MFDSDILEFADKILSTLPFPFMMMCSAVFPFYELKLSCKSSCMDLERIVSDGWVLMTGFVSTFLELG